jgi:hypothetical protein
VHGIGDGQEGELPEIDIGGHDFSDAMLAHQRRGMKVVEDVARRPAKLLHHFRSTASCRSVGMRMLTRSDARMGSTNERACSAINGCLNTRGCVTTRKYS